MPRLDYSPLSEQLRPLLNKFYREHNSPMRAASEGQLWVARNGEIVAGLSLTPIAQGYWLTGLFVDPAWRRQQVARTLVTQALKSLEGSVWLFCHPELGSFYQSLGFQPDPPLPQSLAERLARYSRNKSLIALGMTLGLESLKGGRILQDSIKPAQSGAE